MRMMPEGAGPAREEFSNPSVPCRFPLSFYNNELNSPNSMNIQFHIRGLNDNSDLRRRLLQLLEPLQSLIAITAVAVVLEHRRDQAPPFRAFVLLAIPGPDIHAEASDHTLEAAWLKVTSDLQKQIERRKNRQATQHKSDRQLRGAAGDLATRAATMRTSISR
jgi:ribosome-associated translation inhibitor RaiA